MVPLFFLAKTFYFMKLIDQIAPLVDIIIRVFIDIKWFMFVFLMSITAFGISFNLLAIVMCFDHLDIIFIIERLCDHLCKLRQ